MKVKLILGEYAYLYHGPLNLQEIDNYIKSLTQFPFFIKWKDGDDEMIRILRPQDLKYCVDATSKLNQTLRLYIQECLPTFQQQNQKLQFQQLNQSMLQSNCQQVQASNQFEIEKPQLKKEITFADQMSSENIGSSLPFNEKQQFLQHIVKKTMNQVYPGLDLDFDFDEANENLKSRQMQESQPIFVEQQIGNLQKQAQSKLNPQKIKTLWNEKQQEGNFCQDNPPNETSQFFLQPQSKPSIKLENINDNQNWDNIASARQNDNQDIYFCDYCSEQIEKLVYCCKSQECCDIHYCQACKELNIHEHELVVYY